MAHRFGDRGILVAGRDIRVAGGCGALVRTRVDRLSAQGLLPGQVVLCPDTPVGEVALMTLALMRLGAALLPYRTGVNPLRVVELAAATGAEWRWSPGSASLHATGSNPAPAAPLDTELALLVGTSGSSGGSKIAMLTRSNLAASAAAVNQRLGFGADGVWLGCLRLSHIGGLAIIHRWALAEATLILHAAFDAEAVAEDLQRHAVTHLSLVPPMLARLLDAGAAPPASLRVVLVGGQALGSELAGRAIAAGWPLYPTYGMTETASQIATSTRALEHASDGGLVGPLLAGVEIAPPDPSGVPHRLRLRGPMLMAGYANPARRLGSGLEDGWFETSDLGSVDPDGRLHLIGRADDVVVIGGSNVSLTRVEGLLRDDPRVRELVVTALPDTVWGHRLVVVYSGSQDESALRDRSEALLSGPERPRLFKQVARLPLLDSGKYDRLAIRALALRAVESCDPT